MNKLPPLVKDKQGQRFGRLTVIGFVGVQKRKAQWLCQCDCGNKTVVLSGNLRVGKTKSCGCLSVENARTVGLMRPSKSTSPAGPERDRLQKIHRGMIDRCRKPSCPAFLNYGARGISICDEWLENFDAFYEWSVANGYSSDLTLDRIDNDKGYSPDNCRWATRQQQAQNRRSTNIQYAFGEEKCFTEWMRDTRTVVSIPTVRQRLKSGWEFESAISTRGMSKRDAALSRWS